MPHGEVLPQPRIPRHRPAQLPPIYNALHVHLNGLPDVQVPAATVTNTFLDFRPLGPVPRRTLSAPSLSLRALLYTILYKIPQEACHYDLKNMNCLSKLNRSRLTNLNDLSSLQCMYLDRLNLGSLSILLMSSCRGALTMTTETTSANPYRLNNLSCMLLFTLRMVSLLLALHMLIGKRS